MAWPWPRTQPHDQPSGYSSLKQDEAGDSESSASMDVSYDAQRVSQYARRRFIVSFTMNAILCVVVLVLVAAWHQAIPRRLVPSPVPEFPSEVRTFKLDPLFLSLPDEASTAAWEGLPGPNGRGFIRLDGYPDFDFPDRIAGLSVFHQLHCLGALRKFMWQLVYGQVDTEKMLREWPENVTSPSYHQATHTLWHYAHCFDYLRQGIQCSGDVSLEFVSELTGMAVVDGLDFPHQCKNWDAIWEYAEELM